jgi:hypothetical protein
MVGRDGELARVTRLLEDALAGRGRLVLCTGEAGIGKTRLGEELTTAAAASGVPVAWARAADRGSSPPYGLWWLVMDEPAIRGDVGGGPRPDLWSQVFGEAERPALTDGADSGSVQRFALFAEVRRQRRLHTVAADAIETLYEGQVRLHLAEVARHRVEAALPGDRADRTRAVAACEAAADVAAEAVVFEEAVRLYRQALSAGGEEIGEVDQDRLELALAAVLHRSGDLPGAQETAVRVGRRAERRRDRPWLARTAWPQRTGRRGRPRTGGDRLPCLAELAATTAFTQVTVTRYGKAAAMRAAAVTCLWPAVFGARQVTVGLIRDRSATGYDLAWSPPIPPTWPPSSAA